MAFDTIFAEEKRCYVESLSSYARHFFGKMDKPKYDTIRGLSPTISIEKKAVSKNPRSTVRTITEVYDYLRVLYARMGVQHCHKCGKEVGRGDPESMASEIMELEPQTKILLLAPVIENRKGEHKDLPGELKSEGFQRVRFNGVISTIDDIQALAKHKKYTIEVLVDLLVVKKISLEFRTSLLDSIETVLKMGKGQIIVH